MKAGDLVYYVSDAVANDQVVGIIIKTIALHKRGWATVVWSTNEGSYHDEVPLSSLKVIE
jgi:hypothetical protein